MHVSQNLDIYKSCQSWITLMAIWKYNVITTMFLKSVKIEGGIVFCVPTAQDMNDPLKWQDALEDVLLEKLNIFCFLSNLTHFHGNLKIWLMTKMFQKGGKMEWGRVFVTLLCINHWTYELFIIIFMFTRKNTSRKLLLHHFN